MKKLKKQGNKFTIEFEKVDRVTETYEREFVVDKIDELKAKIENMKADKAKYEEILTLIDAQ